MSARSPAQAVENYRESLQRLLSCVTREVLVTYSLSAGNPYQPGDQPHVLALGRGGYVALQGPDPLLLRVLYRYDIIGSSEARDGWLARSREYTYTIAMQDVDARGEIVTYHWQPDARYGSRSPHAHVGPAIVGTSLRFGNRNLHRLHFPTGKVPLASIIHLLIEEFGVQPLRDDWRDVLHQVQSSA